MDSTTVDLIEQASRQGYTTDGRGWLVIFLEERSRMYYVGADDWPEYLRTEIQPDPDDDLSDLAAMLRTYEPAAEYLLILIENGEMTPVQMKYRLQMPPMA